MVKIRLARGGSKKRPFYHIIATDKRSSRDAGSYLERLGFYNPIAQGQEVPFSINQERVSYWLEKGAQPSERVAQLLKDNSAA